MAICVVLQTREQWRKRSGAIAEPLFKILLPLGSGPVSPKLPDVHKRNLGCGDVPAIVLNSEISPCYLRVTDTDSWGPLCREDSGAFDMSP